MSDQNITTHVDTTTLNEKDRELLTIARESLSLSYAPYSNFRVGAALRTDAGHVMRGANQENASFPLCMCGERVALYNSVIHFPGEVIRTLAICVTSDKGVQTPAPPCGACLQVICEFEDRQKAPIRMLLQADSPVVYEVESARTLMPMHFDGSFL